MAEKDDATLTAEVQELFSLRKISHKKEARVLVKLEQVVAARKQQVEELEWQLDLLKEHRDKLIEAFSMPTFPNGYKPELVAGHHQQDSEMQEKNSRKTVSSCDKQADDKELSSLHEEDLHLASSQIDLPVAMSKPEEDVDCKHESITGNPAACVESDGKALLSKDGFKRSDLKTWSGESEKKKRKLASPTFSSLTLETAIDFVRPNLLLVDEKAHDRKKNGSRSSEQVSELVRNTACSHSGGPNSESSKSESGGMSCGTLPKVISRGLNGASLGSKQELSLNQDKVTTEGSSLLLPKAKPGQCFDQAVLSLQGLLDQPGNVDTRWLSQDELPLGFASCQEYKARLQPLIIRECKAMMSCWVKEKDQIKLEITQKLNLQQFSTDSSRGDLVLWELRCLESKGIYCEVEARHVLGGPQRFFKNDLVLIILPPLCTIRVAIVHHDKPLVILRMRADPDSNIRNCFIRSLGNMQPLKRIYKAVCHVDTIVDPLRFQLLHPLANDNLLMSSSNTAETEHSISIKSRTVTSWLLASSFNSQQLRAIDALLQLSEGFFLVQGPPGTGKTSTICGMVSALLIEKPLSKILICAPSNGALDEIVLRLATNMLDGEGKPYSPEKGDIVRLGKRTSIRTVCKAFTIDALVSQNLQHISEKDVVLRAKVIFVTLNGCGHHSLKDLEAKFDLVIVDEAVQAVEAEICIALRKAKKKCVLVGDPCQLAATVLQYPACAYRRSLFERLEGAGLPVHVLEIQYRMDPAISSYPSRQFYKGRLRSSSKGVPLETMFKPEACKEGIVCHNYRFKLGPYFFLDVRQGFDVKDNIRHSRGNNEEVLAVCSVVQGVVNNMRSGVHLGIGIITPYFQQRKLITRQLKKSNISSSLYEVDTVDGFQGREKDIIILSCVRAVPGEGVGFISDERRINVALTRAKHVLLILGHAETLQKESPFWKDLIDDARSRGNYQVLNFCPKKGDNKLVAPTCRIETAHALRGLRKAPCHSRRSKSVKYEDYRVSFRPGENVWKRKI